MAAFPDLIPQQVNQNLNAFFHGPTQIYAPLKLTVTPLKQDGTAWDATNTASVQLYRKDNNSPIGPIYDTVSPATFVAGATTVEITLTAAELATLLNVTSSSNGQFTVALSDTTPTEVFVAAGQYGIIVGA